MTDREPKVGISIDIEADGKQFGHLSVPNSRNESGWGALHLPIVSIRNGAGSTVAFTGGNHGDEYEGPIALLKLARALVPSQISGRVIVIPALNFPAVMGGTRVSPIDGVNMNRAFPGRRDGSVTRMIAHFVQHRILPVCDALFDIHSGGKTMMFSPFVCYHRLADEVVAQAPCEVRCAAGPSAVPLARPRSSRRFRVEQPARLPPRTDKACAAPFLAAGLPGASYPSQPRTFKQETPFGNFAQL